MSAVERVLAELKNDPVFAANVSQWQEIPAREGTYAPLPSDLHPRLRATLEAGGVRQLYNHQADSYRAVRSGRDVVVVTPTASGKTLSYNLAILQELLHRPEARALYLFPTKALSQDQQAGLNLAVEGGELGVKVATYDGDTPDSVRASARETGQIIISNPDMLHSGILPNHPKWIKFLGNLAFVVIDEIHTYRGVFGSHMTNVVRRLRRITEFYGADPTFICCSATIGNPRELAERIIGRNVELIDNNGAPSGAKHLILYNPPFVDRVQGIRKGVVQEARALTLRFLKAGVKTIVFARSRLRTELIAAYIRRSLENVYTDHGRINVEAYRGGYLPSERRAIERGLRDGTVQGVVSTNALELGIDIGGLDAAVLAGFPGSISSSWQQAGRAGRTRNLSVAVLVASSSPLDQYMVKHPHYFLGRAPEQGFVDPDNLHILISHLRCAVFELPMKPEERYAPQSELYLQHLEEEGTVRLSAGMYHWSDRSYPAESVSLRSATADNVVIVDSTNGEYSVIGETDRPSAKEVLFDNAIYIHRGEQYVVTELDLENRKCLVERTDVNYYTEALVKRDIKVLHEDETRHAGGSRLVLGDILVRTQVAKFKKIRFQSHENVGYGEVSVPEEEMHTRALTIVFDPDTRAGGALRELDPAMRVPAVVRIGTLVKNVAPVFLLCEATDLRAAERLKDPHFGQPCLYIYDGYPGGIGLAEAFAGQLEPILAAALSLVRDCECSEGCPSCVGPRDPQEEIDGNPKEAVSAFLAAWLSVSDADAEPAQAQDG